VAATDAHDRIRFRAKQPEVGSSVTSFLDSFTSAD
jgi:hypothetical protein